MLDLEGTWETAHQGREDMRQLLTPEAPTLVGRPRSTPTPAAPGPSPGPVAPNREAALTLRCRRLFRAVAVLLCGLHAYVARHTINPDGISYLDVADAYRAGDLAAALNAYWSPLYSWLLAAALAVARPSPYWECTVAHAVNFGIFLVALAAFEWLLSELLAFRRGAGDAAREGWQDAVPDWFVAGFA